MAERQDNRKGESRLQAVEMRSCLRFKQRVIDFIYSDGQQSKGRLKTCFQTAFIYRIAAKKAQSAADFQFDFSFLFVFSRFVHGFFISHIVQITAGFGGGIADGNAVQAFQNNGGGQMVGCAVYHCQADFFCRNGNQFDRIFVFRLANQVVGQIDTDLATAFVEADRQCLCPGRRVRLYPK